MTADATIRTILDGPVHCFRRKDSTFWFTETEGMTDTYICHDSVKEEWTVHSYGYLGTGKTLALAYESLFLKTLALAYESMFPNKTEDWYVD